MECPKCYNLMIKKGTSIRCLKCSYKIENKESIIVQKYGEKSSVIVENIASYLCYVMTDAFRKKINELGILDSKHRRFENQVLLHCRIRQGQVISPAAKLSFSSL